MPGNIVISFFRSVNLSVTSRPLIDIVGERFDNDRMRRAAVIFDLDGTLTEPFLDFDAIREEIGLPPGPILESLAALPLQERERADGILRRREWDAARHATLHAGAREAIDDCRSKGFATAILTRNARAPAEHVMTTFGLEVDALWTRDDGPVKPSPEPVWALCRILSAEPRRSWVVGDYLFDLQAGRAAGTGTVLMIGKRDPPSFAELADVVIRSLGELSSVLPKEH